MTCEPRPDSEEFPVIPEVTAGRSFLGPLPDNRDLVDTISAACRRHGLVLATFRVHGVVTRATLGVYDPRQQVYVTATETFDGEIVGCSGIFTDGPAGPEVIARMAVADDAGNVIGGRLFSDTMTIGADIHIQEWLGPKMHRQMHPDTGLAVLTPTAQETAGAPS